MPKEEAAKGSRGGEARRDALIPEQRAAIARKAAETRWGADLPRASHDGPLHIGDAILIAAVLPNGKRLLSQGTVLQAIGRSRTPKAGTGGFSAVNDLPFFLRADVLKPFISEELLISTTPIHFRLKQGAKSVGYDAMLLPMICEVYLKFRDHLNAEIGSGDAPRKRTADGLLKRYRHIIHACDTLTRGLARRGIIALVDDATGYQNDRIREEVERLVIEAYVTPKLQPWTRKFPHEFFKEAYRILGWEYRPGQIKHPSYMGKFINKFVYDALPPGVADELRNVLPKNEKGNRRAKLWQALTSHTGNPHLDKQLNDDILLMQISEDRTTFERNWQKAFGIQRLLPLEIIKRLQASN